MKSKTLIIGDIHFRNFPMFPEYLVCQVNTVASLINRHAEECDSVIFLGDIFHFEADRDWET